MDLDLVKRTCKWSVKWTWTWSRGLEGGQVSWTMLWSRTFGQLSCEYSLVGLIIKVVVGCLEQTLKLTTRTYRGTN